jgi:hypothetical protein
MSRRVGPRDTNRRLPHSSGANVEDPFLEVGLTLAYWQGEWTIRRHDQYGNDNGELVELDRSLVEVLHEALEGTGAGFTAPEVLDRNRVKWLEASEAHAVERHRRAVQAAEVALVEARRARARAMRSRVAS